MRIDLHTHSDRSDGTMSPADLVAAAAEAGLDVIAITDHVVIPPASFPALGEDR